MFSQFPSIPRTEQVGRHGLEWAADAAFRGGPVPVGKRQAPSAIFRSDVDSFRDGERVIKFDAQESDRAVDLDVAEQELERSQKLWLSVMEIA